VRVLIAIPHYVDPAGSQVHGSLGDEAWVRAAALSQCLRALSLSTSPSQAMWFREHDHLVPVNLEPHHTVTADVVICTSGRNHCLSQLVPPHHAFHHHPTAAEPRLLGFECHAVLHAHLGQYDLYGYLEDDLLIHDQAFWSKQAWFHSLSNDGCVLQPNRYELITEAETLRKVYIDFEFASYADLRTRTDDTITGQVFGSPVTFHRTSNPHAGCFFLTNRQMALWASQPYFLDRATRFVGPLESAATLGLVRTFRVYKPAPAHASFLEIEHYGQTWSGRLPRVRLPV
jgi:hypothetical protein